MMVGMSTGETWRLGHRPALDGLRGIAVLLVVLSHGRVPGMEAGAGTAGVAVFFTLSGFLITTLLLEERTRTGRLDLGRFYYRRALRLLPAMLVMVATVSALGVALGSRYVEGINVAGTLLYFANWVTAGGEHLTGALGHMWSLSVEEQFYIAWPLLLPALLRFRRSTVLVILGAASVGSLLLRFALVQDFGHWRVYFGTDTRADELLIGCALAVAMHGRIEGRVRPVLAFAALGGILLTVTGSMAFIFLVLPTVVAALTAVAIFAVVRGEDCRALSWAPLAKVGQRSYALYLWHWPVVMLADRVLGQPEWVLLVVAPVSWGLALLSWRFVEAPMLRLRSADARRSVARLDRAPLQDASATSHP